MSWCDGYFNLYYHAIEKMKTGIVTVKYGDTVIDIDKQIYEKLIN